MLKQLTRQRGKSDKEMIVIDKTGSSDSSKHRMDAQKHREFPILVEKLEWNIKENFFFYKRLHRNLFKSPVYTVQILRRHVSLVGD